MPSSGQRIHGQVTPALGGRPYKLYGSMGFVGLVPTLTVSLRDAQRVQPPGSAAAPDMSPSSGQHPT